MRRLARASSGQEKPKRRLEPGTERRPIRGIRRQADYVELGSHAASGFDKARRCQPGAVAALLRSSTMRAKMWKWLRLQVVRRARRGSSGALPAGENALARSSFILSE